MDRTRPLLFVALLLAIVGAFFAGAVLAPFTAPVEPGEGGRELLGAGGAFEAASRGGEGFGPRGSIARAEDEEEALDLAAIRAAEASAKVAAEMDFAPAAVGASEKPIATGAITGVVLDIAGQPIAGVLLRARPMGDARWRERQLEDLALRPRDGSPPIVDLQRSLRQAAQNFARFDGRMLEATSDAEGGFRFEDLSSEAWRIEAYAKGWQLRSSLTDDPRIWPGQKLDFTGTRLERVEVAVLDSVEAPVARASLDVFTPNQGEEQRLWTQEEPYLWLAPGTYRVRARLKPGQAPASETSVVVVDPGVAVPPLRLVLQDESRVVGALSGEVLTRFGRRAIGIEIADAGSGPEMEWEYYGGGYGGRRTRGAEIEEVGGELRYRLEGLKPGKQKLRVRLGRALILEERELEIPTGELRVDLDLALPSGTRVVEAVVLDGAGLPQLDARVHVQTRGGERRSGESAVALPAEAGRWWLVHHPKLLEQASTWTFVAHVQSQRQGVLQQVYKPEQEERLELRFAEPAHLLVRVNGAAPKGVMVQLALQPEKKSESDPQEEETNAGLGEATEVALGPLRPGRYKLLVRGAQRDWNWFTLLEESIELRPGRQERALTLPELHTLAIRVTDAQPGQSQRGSIWRADDPSSSFRTSFQVNGGNGEIAGLPAGRYEAELSERGQSSARRESFSVPGTSTLVFGPANPNAAPKLGVRVDLQDPQGRAARAGLMQGDVVVGIAGKRFEKAEEVMPRFSGAPYYLSGGSIALEVERAGAIVRLEVETDVLLQPQNSGVRFRPSGR